MAREGTALDLGEGCVVQGSFPTEQRPFPVGIRGESPCVVPDRCCWGRAATRCVPAPAPALQRWPRHVHGNRGCWPRPEGLRGSVPSCPLPAHPCRRCSDPAGSRLRPPNPASTTRSCPSVNCTGGQGVSPGRTPRMETMRDKGGQEELLGRPSKPPRGGPCPRCPLG